MSIQSVEDLPSAIDRALDGRSILVLPHTRDGAITEVAPGQWSGAGRAPALVLFTSGSTGTAKAVALSAEALITSARATERFLAGPGDWLLRLPINHIAGFQVELRARLAGREPIRATSATFTAEAFADEAAQLFARSGERPTYTSLVPTQLHRILGHERATLAAATFDAILLGGSAISPVLLDRADARGLRIVRTYGMSETAGGCVYNGVPFDGVEIAITESSTIDLSGRVVADSYVQITSEGHIAPLEGPDLSTSADGGRTMHTSDLGRLDDGVLTVLGRSDDIIVSGGTNVSPHALETGLLPTWQHHGIAEVLVTSVPDEEWGRLLVALVRIEGEVTEAMTDSMGSPRGLALWLGGLDHGMQDQLLPRLVFPVVEIPHRSIGKPDRQSAAGLAAKLLDQQVEAGSDRGSTLEYPNK